MNAAPRLGINGRFLASRVTGVQRFAHEVTARIERLQPTALFLPADAPQPRDLAEDTIVIRGRLRGQAFEQLELPHLTHSAGCNVTLHLAGTAPFAGQGDVIVIHDVLPLTHPRWFSRRFRTWRRVVLGQTAPRAARIVTVTSWSADEIARTLRVDRRRILVAPQGVAPFDRPAPAAAVSAALETIGVSSPFLLAVGAGDPRKNHAFLGQVLRRWREQETPPPLVLAGASSPRYFAESEEWTRGLAVLALGHTDDATLHALYTGAAALCYPSVAEGYGRPPLEALACGTPAVVADYPCAAEVVAGGACILPLDVELWLRALQRLVRQQRRAAGNAQPSAAPGAAAADARGRGAATNGHTAPPGWDEAAAVVLRACEEARHERASRDRR